LQEYTLRYGTGQLQFNLPEHLQVDEYFTTLPQQPDNTQTMIENALLVPLSNLKIEEFLSSESIGIVINDKTRPLPNTNLIKPLINHLQWLGFDKSKIKFFIGTGTHIMTPEELPRILPEEIINDYSITIHNCDTSTMIDLGITNYKTPVRVNAEFFNCDLKIAIGNIEPHHFMGYSGGVKTAAIGLACRETITRNHAMLVHPNARSGVFFTNPMRQDLEQIGAKIGIHFCLGTIIDGNKNILRIFFGDPKSVMQNAVPATRDVFGVRIPNRYDLVITSPGGMPKDINLYQAQKALTPAANITKDGGWVVLLAACPEGSGSQKFEDYIASKESHQEIIKHFKAGYFEVGPHKAYQFAREAVRINIIIVSEIPPEDLKRWKLTPSQPKFIQPLLDWIINKYEINPKIAILPDATHMMTEVKNESN
jgi:nickel-dependent lactate racemase